MLKALPRWRLVVAVLKFLAGLFLWLHRQLFVMCTRHRVPPLALLGVLIVATKVFQTQYSAYPRPLLLFGLAQLWALATLFLPNRQGGPFLIIQHPLLPGRLSIHLNGNSSAMIARSGLADIAKLAKACNCRAMTMDSPLLVHGPTQRLVATLMERAFRVEGMDVEVLLGNARPWSMAFSSAFSCLYAERIAKLGAERIQRIGRWRVASSAIVIRQLRGR
jgi:hypothetical protein